MMRVNKQKMREQTKHELHLCQKCLQNGIIKIYDIKQRQIGEMCLICNYKEVKAIE